MTLARVRVLSVALAAAAFVISALVIFCRNLEAIWDFTVDDAFITFRYSSMLAAGEGPTFNGGQDPVEGYTSFLWMTLLAVPELLQLDTELIAKVTGVLLTLATASMVAHAVLVWAKPSPLALRVIAGSISVFGFLSFQAVAVHASAGMETALFTAILFAVVLTASLHIANPRPRTGRLLAVLALLLGLTRPEGVLFGLVAIAGTYAYLPRSTARELLRSAAYLYALPALVYFAARFAYYRHPFPVSYYLKVDAPTGLPGLPYVDSYAKRLFGAVLLSLAAFLPPPRRLLRPVGAVAVVVLIFGTVPEYIIGYQWRFVYPVTPVIYALAGVGIVDLAVVAMQRRSLRPVVGLGWSVVALATVLFWRQPDPPATGIAELKRSVVVNDRRELIGRYLASYTGAETPTVALQDAGAVPYYSDWNVVDYYGLNDAYIGIEHGFSAKYVLDRHPDVIIIPSFSQEVFSNYDPDAKALYKAARRAAEVRPVVSVSMDWLGYWLLLARPNTPVAKHLQRWQAPGVTPTRWLEVFDAKKRADTLSPANRG